MWPRSRGRARPPPTMASPTTGVTPWPPGRAPPMCASPSNLLQRADRPHRPSRRRLHGTARSPSRRRAPTAAAGLRLMQLHARAASARPTGACGSLLSTCGPRLRARCGPSPRCGTPQPSDSAAASRLAARAAPRGRACLAAESEHHIGYNPEPRLAAGKARRGGSAARQEPPTATAGVAREAAAAVARQGAAGAALAASAAAAEIRRDAGRGEPAADQPGWSGCRGD